MIRAGSPILLTLRTMRISAEMQKLNRRVLREDQLKRFLVAIDSSPQLSSVAALLLEYIDMVTGSPFSS